MNSTLVFIGFAFLTSITPGPNNLGIAAMAYTHGLRKTVPTLLGVVTGFAVLMFASTLGLSGIETTAMMLSRVLGFVGGVLLIGLVIAALIGRNTAHTLRVPKGFGPGFIFQFINPKGWLMATGAASVFSIGAEVNIVAEALAMASLFAVVMLPSVLVWAVFGSWLSDYLSDGSKTANIVSTSTLAVIFIMGVVMIVESFMVGLTTNQV